MTMEALLIAAAALAAGGAVVAGVLAFRGRRPTDDPGSIRRAPSPSSVGLADDPIVAGMGVDGDGRTRMRHTERIDPPI